MLLIDRLINSRRPLENQKAGRRTLINSPRRLENQKAGRRAFILANGPSVRDADLSLLRGELVIGMNASPMLDAEYGFRTSYYVVSDNRFLNHPEKRQWATSRLDTEVVRVLRSDLRAYDDPDFVGRTFYVRVIARDGFSENLNAGFYYGSTTTMLAIQLAYYLGCGRIYLLGCDLRYAGKSPRFYDESDPQLEDSFISVQIWNIVKAAEIIEKRGRALVGCSENSLLRPYLPYEKFASLF